MSSGSSTPVKLSALTTKRLQNDLKLLTKEPMDLLDAFPKENNQLEWDFLIVGPPDTDFHNGHFLGKIIHNPEYPAKPPDFMMLTPSGRFKIGAKICLSNSGYHSESWNPIWNVKAILNGFLSIMTDDKYEAQGLNHIQYDDKSERGKREKTRILKEFAAQSYDYNIKNHKDVYMRFTRFVDKNGKPIFAASSGDAAKKEADKKETDKKEADKKEADKKEVEKQEAAKKDAKIEGPPGGVKFHEEDDEIQKAIRESEKLENDKKLAKKKEDDDFEKAMAESMKDAAQDNKPVDKETQPTTGIIGGIFAKLTGKK